MNDEAAFLRAMQEQPGDASIRLVFADWLEERGDPRGELLRLLNTLTQSIKVRGRKKLEERLRTLVASGVKPVGPFFTNSIGMRFAFIWPGTFLMGSPDDEAERSEDEVQHAVTLTKGFFLAIHPVTQASWLAVMQNNPSQFKDDERPVERVTWDVCQLFLRTMSERDGHSYRFPTEAEWEYSCRAGTTTPFFSGEDISTDQANYYFYKAGMKKRPRKPTTPVGRFPPNAWGLGDMHGNVWEWCADYYGEYQKRKVVDPQGAGSGEHRVKRGGAYNCIASLVRSANRTGNWAVESSAVGFRPVVTFS